MLLRKGCLWLTTVATSRTCWADPEGATGTGTRAWLALLATVSTPLSSEESLMLQLLLASSSALSLLSLSISSSWLSFSSSFWSAVCFSSSVLPGFSPSSLSSSSSSLVLGWLLLGCMLFTLNLVLLSSILCLLLLWCNLSLLGLNLLLWHFCSLFLTALLLLSFLLRLSSLLSGVSSPCT